MKRVLKQSVVAVMVLAGIMAFTGTAGADSGPVPVSDAGFSSTEASQEAPLEMSPQNEWDCWFGVLCLWKGKNATGAMIVRQEQGYGTCRNLGNHSKNVASSVRNRTYKHVRLYKGSNCTGASFRLREGGYEATMPRGFNDNVESFRYIR